MREEIDGRLLIRGLGLVFLVLALGLFLDRLCKSEEARSPDLSLYVGTFQRAKAESEGVGRRVHRRWHAGLIGDREVMEGEGLYTDLSARFNGVISSLEVTLSTGRDASTMAAIRAEMDEARSLHAGFKDWFASLPVELTPVATLGARPGRDADVAAAPDWDLIAHLIDKLAEMDERRRQHLIGMLRECHFPPWSEICRCPDSPR